MPAIPSVQASYYRFRQGLIGLTVGQEYNIPCTFPSDYSSSDLAGKDVIFVVTVKSIQKSTVPDLTDAWVAEMRLHSA